MSELLSHAQVNYRTSAKASTRCGTCAMYRRSPGKPPSCTLVQQPVRPYGVCDRFAPKEKEAA